MSLKRDTLYNVLGSLAPVLIGMVTVPIYLHLIGDARYGVLGLVWLFLGYFGAFDPGISRAATFHIARLHLDEQSKERESVFWTALLVNIAFGLAGAITVYAIARPLFSHFFKMPDAMRAEVLASLPWLAASVPVSIVGGVLVGTLQARERFDLANSTSTLNAVLSQLVPLAVAYFHGPDLKWLIPTVLITRMAGAIPNCIYLKRVVPLGCGGGYDRTLVKTLFSYGGWVTITNLLNPLLSTLDRMLIGGVLNAEYLAYYMVPFNLVTRALILPGAVASSLFPRFSKASEDQIESLAARSLQDICAVFTPVVVIGIAAIPIFMQHWVGKAFAQKSASIGIILLVGVWFNGLAFIPFNYLQSRGRPHVGAIFHAAEVIPFLGILWAGLHFYGLPGAAWAWTLRVALDSALLFAAGVKIRGWHNVFVGVLFIGLAASFSPRSLASVQTLIELAIIGATVFWSWKLNPTIFATIQRFLSFKTREVSAN